MTSTTVLTEKQIQNKIKYLTGKHRELDKIIMYNEQQMHPSSWKEIKNLKKQKLDLKDQIAKLENEKNKL